jgi:hypothetical protein
MVTKKFIMEFLQRPVKYKKLVIEMKIHHKLFYFG